MDDPNNNPSGHPQMNSRPEYRDGKLAYTIKGIDTLFHTDAYYYLMAAQWSRLFFWALMAFLLINTLFALLYLATGNTISDARSGSFSDAFFFSVQTFSTIGYGTMSPKGLFTNILVTFESFIGMISVALGTGLIFAKFSRPSARVAFSKKMVVHNRNGVPVLSFRLANERQSEIVNTQIFVNALITDETDEGHQMRRFFPLKLETDSTPLFALSWTVMHKLDEDSPLYGLTQDRCNSEIVSIIVSFQGTDSTFLQTVQSLHIYRPSDVEFGASFKDMIEVSSDGLIMDHQHLSTTEPV